MTHLSYCGMGARWSVGVGEEEGVCYIFVVGAEIQSGGGGGGGSGGDGAE